MSTPRSTLLFVLAALGSASLVGCAERKEYVRGSQDPNIDAPAMSTGLDKQDIQRMLSECLNELRVDPVMTQWRASGTRSTIAIFPFLNQTTEHIEPQLDAVLSETEQWLFDSRVFTVISRERQNQMIAEVEGQRNPVFNPAHAAQYGRQLGAKYYMTGKIQASDERTEGQRRVQYFVFMQIIEVETSAIQWQHKAYVTKMVR